MSKDITPILAGWEHEPDETAQVRIITGDDGRDKIQMRIDLGLLQMEMSGRPDGRRPDDHESLLEVHEARSKAEDFVLDPGDCAALMREGVQYYQRYLAAFHLQRYDLVVRDTERNLRLFAFVVRHASRQRDKVEFDKYRPYVMMMRTRAMALASLEKNDPALAMVQIDEGIEGIRGFLRDYEQSENEAECMELVFLLRWKRDIESNRPRGPRERLEQQLELAVALEDYEEAALIRDQLARLRGTEIASSEPHRP